MKSTTLMCTATFFATALPLQMVAQHTRYKFIDVPTLGGPAALGQVDGIELTQFINNLGVVVGGANTSIADANSQNGFVVHGFRWQDGVITDLGSLPGVNGSHATSINARGWVTGGSSIVAKDPLTGNRQERAVLWKDDGGAINLGTLGSGLNSAGLYVNDSEEVVGMSTVNPKRDVNLGPWPSATHAFIWKESMMRDLGTLGGHDSFPAGGCNNESANLVAGESFTNSTPNPTTGVPTQHAFLWDGTMHDIPTSGSFAGGTAANAPPFPHQAAALGL